MSKILLIDDDTDMLAMTARWLEKAGHEVTKAASGKEALSILGSFRPDLILLFFVSPDLCLLLLISMVAGKHHPPAQPGR